MDASLRLLLATGLCLAWCVLAARAWQRVRRSAVTPVPVADRLIPIFYASQTGSAVRLAQQAVQAIGAHKARAMPIAALTPALLQETPLALFIISTTGEGDPPDMAWPFVSHYMANEARGLDAMQYGLLALGDRRYRNFCGFALQVEHWLRAGGARPLFAPVLADSEDAGSLGTWMQRLEQHLGAGKVAVAEEARLWQLSERRLVNAGSTGQACYLLTFACEDNTPTWQAGDIASVAIAGANQWRDYSIASLPADGVLQLLIRLHSLPDGSHSRGSRWLTQSLQPGESVQISLRTNPGFHLAPGESPAVFIGSGTGIAGLRSLLKARVAKGLHNNWLIFGERHAGIDEPFGPELRELPCNGQVARLDLTFSRDATRPAYVYEVLEAEHERLCEWVDGGAAIYVCGSRQGMAADVDNTLQRVLGHARYQALRHSGRYRRDVY